MSDALAPFRKILVYASVRDEGFRALDQAASLARTAGATIHVLRILEPAGVFSRLRPNSTRDELLRKLVEESHGQLLQQRVAELRDGGLEVGSDVCWGTPWLELLRAISREGYDLVIKAADGATHRQTAFFGSTAMHLIRKCPCPVWIVGQSHPGADRRVLAAIDPEPDGNRLALAEELLCRSSSLAGAAGELHAATAWLAPAESLLNHRMPADELAAYVENEREIARAGLDRALAGAGSPILPEHLHVLKGRPSHVLPLLVEREAIDLLVMGSLGRVGIAGLLIGETAEEILGSVRCSVLVVKPPGFRCPVDTGT